ncbi:hypothetical protein PRK78_003864 [Emydomyces testavorans]|uniref:HNH nuclease domain-containing protein n=1 Tax=Emydomyces testavorans TaxID=2070801 RepID=A0AAF0DGT2_9EURO|nr:hypothetical protein PRK78_003864 [Emydomyces testavorans]
MSQDEVAEALIASVFSIQSSVPSQVDKCAAENRVASYHPQDNEDHTKEVLLSFLCFLPAEGRQMLAEAIILFDNSQLFALYKHLLTSILIPMKTRTAMLAITPSSFDNKYDAVEQIAALMDKSPSRNSKIQLKELCLRRDNFRCMATGVIEESSGIESSASDIFGPTELAHIIPFSIAQWDNKQKDHKVSQIWATLLKCFPNIALRPSDINQPSNLMTLFSLAHKAFGEFSLAFEPTDETDKYKILTFSRNRRTALDLHLPPPNAHGERIVKFETHADVELPSRQLLQTHAALAKILHTSGMAEYIDEIMRDREEIGCLASDGSTNIQKLLFVF